MLKVSTKNLASSRAQRTAAAPAVRLAPCARLPCSQSVFGSAVVDASSSASQWAPSSRQVTARVAAPDAPSKSSETKTWYAVVASADFFFNDPQNESLAEQMRERVRFFSEQGQEQDFYIVPEPKWLDAKYPNEAKRVKRPCVALVSTDKNWIVFMKVRLDRVMRFDLGQMSDKEVLAMGGDVPEYKPPAKWTAPYAPYTPGWWKKFYPKK